MRQRAQPARTTSLTLRPRLPYQLLLVAPTSLTTKPKGGPQPSQSRPGQSRPWVPRYSYTPPPCLLGAKARTTKPPRPQPTDSTVIHEPPSQYRQ
ncbi:hypothetical protein BDP81DRAFT_434025 [Colletotrichum phormii]|uniref:Uncharacterized protein n=1 Tax=Colletotrichum phormii TaxID=359342 RepID=A0AAJ0EE23_9PEZI|nr:uncharacterized protein BDP81DRAFT_434025 [Colletotrichum phormii]KAK1633565.1 hypothetical protein BDP81DRAFT_434025 [Colletotrichum phormii]